jgi:hypothetical protein
MDNISENLNTMNKKIGDEVWIDGFTSMAQQSAQEWCKIKNIRHKFDSDTGKPYPIYLVNDNWYDSRNGQNVDNPKSMYYIVIK